MKKLLFFVCAACCLATSTATAQVDITFSTSAVNPTAGAVLNLVDGGSGSLFVWADNTDASGNAIDRLSLDISGSGPSALTANAFTHNPSINWDFGTFPGTLGVSPGLLVDDSNAVAVINGPDDGIQNGVGPVLFAQLDLTATGVGSNNLSFAVGGFGISLEGTPPQSTTFGIGSVNVTSVPEPSALGLVGSIVGAAFLRRRRRL